MPCAVIVDQYEGLGESFISNGAKDKKLEGFYTFLIIKDKTAKSSKKSCCVWEHGRILKRENSHLVAPLS